MKKEKEKKEKSEFDKWIDEYFSLPPEEQEEIRKKNERFARKMQSGAATDPSQLRPS